MKAVSLAVVISCFRSFYSKVSQHQLSLSLKTKVVVGVYVDKLTRFSVADELAKSLLLPIITEGKDEIHDILIGWNEEDYLQLFWGGRALLKEKPFSINFFDDHYLRRKEGLSS